MIIKRMKRRMKRKRKKSSRTNPFSMTISTLISTFNITTITSNSTFNLNLTLFEPHPTPPFHSPRNPHSPLSSPCPLSPHSNMMLSTLRSYCFALGSWITEHANIKTLKISLPSHDIILIYLTILN